MVATRTGQHAGQQQALNDMPGVDVKRKTGGGKQANERPQEERPLKRTKGGGRTGKKAAAAAEARDSHAHEQEQETAANDARAVVAAVDTGEDPQQKLQKDTKQAGLKAEGGGSGSGSGEAHDSKAGGSGSGDGDPHDSKAEGGAAKDVHMDKSDHGNAKPGAQRSGASGKGSETRAAKAMDPGKVRGYLKRAFGDDLGDVEAAMGELAAAYGKDDIGGNAYRLYENFRPTVSDGTRGWGAKADLDLGLLRALAHQHQQGSS